MRAFNITKKKISSVLLGLGLSSAAFAAPLNGTYTIGGTSPSFATLSAAITALNTDGVSGPVTFNIRNGNYTATTWRAEIKAVTGASAANRVTIKSETNNPANVTIKVDATAAATNYVIKLNNASFVTIKDLTLANEGASYGRIVEFAGTSANDSLVNCRLTSIARTTDNTAMASVYATSLKGANNVIMGNTFTNNSYGAYYYGTSTSNKVDNNAFLNNTFTNQYCTGVEVYYTDNFRFNGNTITTNSGITTYYGLNTRYCDEALEIMNNKISGYVGGYGMYLYYNDGSATARGRVANNVIANNGGTGTARGIHNYYSNYQSIYNNTVKITGTSATAAIPGYFYFSSASYENNEIKNNVFANTGGGYAMYVYNPTFNNTWDYNNLYTTGAKLVDQGTPSTDYATLTAWRAAMGHDMNSISYDPAFSSATNLTPDPSNDASWSLNGRGVHISSNNKDINGNTRATTLAAGVPDIGAYEFTPSVAPPAAQADPVAPAAGTTQVFTFGRDTVAKISWAPASTVPGAITVRQYTGTLPAGITSISPTSMYFYTDINVASATYNHTTDIYYKEPWMGTLAAAEEGLRLAKKEGANPWVASSPTVSNAIPLRNIITTSGLTDFGQFTGIDIANNASTAAIIGPSGNICAGTYAVSARIKNTGSNTITKVQVGWSIDGVPQASVTYSTALAAKAEAVVPLGNITFNNTYHTLKVWTFLPNDIADMANNDDTLSFGLRDGLSGVLTVGGVTPDYPTVVDAIKDLNAFGVCGPVTFNIRDGVYNGQAVINKVTGASVSKRVVFQSESGNASAVTISYTATGTGDNYVLQLNDASFITLKNLTLAANGAAHTRALQYVAGTSKDSVIGCRLTGPVLTTYSVNTCLLFADDIAGTDNVFKGNTFLNGSCGAYYRGAGTSALAEGIVFDGNIFDNQFTYAAYPYYTKDMKFTNNTVTTNSTDNTFYGLYAGYCDGALEVTRNTVTGALGGYGLYIYYCDATSGTRGVVANNVVSMGAGTNTVYGMRIYYSSYQDVYNNSVNVLGGSATASWAGNIYSTSATYDNNVIRNNVFANQGQGYALYVYNPTYNTSDHNNLFTNGTKLVDRGTPAAEFATLQEWRTNSGQEMNSIAYDPGFMSSTDLRPDPANPASWSLNGRGVHIAGNALDKDNNTRITALADGVPDIGAYEFTPTVVPPVAVATPAIPAPGVKQVFTFGQDTVMVIDWRQNSVMPNFMEVRQYSGVKAPQYPASNFMYFYTDVNTQTVTHNFDASVYYKDSWRGTVASEANLRMMKKWGTNAWTAFNGTESVVNTGLNTITAPSLSSMGIFTGGNDNDVFSANIKPATTTVFCPGGSAVLMANTGTGYTYQWNYNGTAIAGATGGQLTATMAGDYTVTVTDNVNNRTATSDKVAITIIPAPAAQISASGALTYCIGSSLALSTPAASGLSYQWQLNGANIAGATNATHTVAGAGIYTVLVNNIGCGTLSPMVNVAAGPLQLSLGADTAFCESPTATLLLDAGHKGATYTWNTGANTQQLAAVTSGEYWVEVNAGPGCVARDTIEVIVNPLPSVFGISYTRSGATYNFSATGAQNVDDYLWLFNDGVTSSDPNPSHTFTIAPTEVKLVVINDCGNDTIALNLTTSVNDVRNSDIAFSLYPNPATDKVTIETDGIAIKHVAVVNQLGQVLLKQEFENNTKKQMIDVSDLPAGYYLLRATTADGLATKPFNIVR